MEEEKRRRRERRRKRKGMRRVRKKKKKRKKIKGKHKEEDEKNAVHVRSFLYKKMMAKMHDYEGKGKKKDFHKKSPKLNVM